MTDPTAPAVTILRLAGRQLRPADIEQLDSVPVTELVTPVGRCRPPGTEPGYQVTLGADRHGWLVIAVFPEPDLLEACRSRSPDTVHPGCEACGTWCDYTQNQDADEFRRLADLIGHITAETPAVLLDLDGQDPGHGPADGEQAGA